MMRVFYECRRSNNGVMDNCIMKRLLIALAASFLVMTVLPDFQGQAQGVSPFSGKGGVKFTDSDLRLLNGTRDALLTGTADSGTKSWSNPKSGVSGKTTLVRSFAKKGLPCREIRYDIDSRGAKRKFVVPYCRVKDGSWKLAF